MSIKEYEKAALERRDFLKAASLCVFALTNLPRKIDGFYGPIEPEPLESNSDSIELIGIEERSGIIEANGMPIIFVPLRSDHFFNERAEIKEWKYDNLTFGFKNIYLLKRNDGTAFRVATLPHITGEKSLPMAILDSGVYKQDTKHYLPNSTYATEINSSSVKAEFSLVGEFYPNKQINLLESAAQILRYQLGKGPFKPGETYSTLDIFDISKANYLIGEPNYNQIQLRGDGVCGMATTLAHLLSQAEVKFNEHQMHNYWNQYWVGPLDENVSVLNDTTISTFDGNMYDFKWTLLSDKPLYISVKAALAPNGNASTDPVGEPNARVGIHLVLTEDEPDTKEELSHIIDLQESYKHFNYGQTLSKNLMDARLLQSFSWDGKNEAEKIARKIYIEEDVENFKEEFRRENFLKDVVSLKSLVDEYIQKHPYEDFDPESTIKLGDFIKQSQWYKSLNSAIKSNLEEILEYTNWHTYKYFTHRGEYEALQCVGWVVLLARLGYDESPEDINSSSAKYARDLIPKELIVDRWRTEMRLGEFYFKAVETLEEYEVGDLFVTYELPFEATPGHVGAIIGKKKVDGTTILLITDSNRKSDGKVRIFTVDESNKYAIFGRPPKRWIVIRKNDK